VFGDLFGDKGDLSLKYVQTKPRIQGFGANGYISVHMNLRETSEHDVVIQL
jgi:hypothetical protein